LKREKTLRTRTQTDGWSGIFETKEETGGIKEESGDPKNRKGDERPANEKKNLKNNRAFEKQIPDRFNCCMGWAAKGGWGKEELVS